MIDGKRNVYHPYYKRWMSMVQRCTNPNNPTYSYYGARGILIHPEWIGRGGFVPFVEYINEHLGKQPSPEYTLDRIDNSRGYMPGNLRWASPREQSLNRRPQKTKSKSGYRGVYWYSHHQVWMARIETEGCRVNLGRFESKHDAARAYNEAAREYHGGYAHLNIIRENVSSDIASAQ